MGRPSWHVGIDIGGTFTDIVAVHLVSRSVRTAKVLSQAQDVLASLHAALGAVDLRWDEVAALVHGTTMVTNAIIENRLSDVALIATEGFSDVIEIGRQNRLHLYRLDAPPKPPCLVPDHRRFEVHERIGPNGEVLTPLEEESVHGLLREIAASGIQSIAVSLLHAYANPTHELLLEPLLRRIVPYVSLSHRINPEEREFERTSATVLNASIMPLVVDYQNRLRAAIPSRTALHFFHSAGGMASAAMTCEKPLILALSGPAAGVAATCQVAARLGLDHLIAFDMGGTSTDVCLISRGLPELRFGVSLAGRQFRQPMIAVESIGAGGGSIARLDRGVLKVGPQSAGADPGPVCYGRGGTEPTVTDAHVVLGYLDPRQALADGIRMDRSLAEEAVGQIASSMNLGLVETALGILRIANATMVRALRNITVEKGIDGRQCALVTYGGVGPMHAATLAREFGIRKVIVPAVSSVFSALGCAIATPSYTQQRTIRMQSSRWDAARVASAREELVTNIMADLGLSIRAKNQVKVEDIALVRFIGQSYSVEVPYTVPAAADAIASDFRNEHRKLYGFASDEPWEIEAIRVRITVQTAVGGAELEFGRSGKSFPEDSISCWFSPQAPTQTPRRWRNGLEPNEHLSGPAIIADEWSTIVVPPGTTLVADTQGNLTMTVGN